MPTLSETLADFVLTTEYKTLPSWIIDRTKMYILDYLGVALLGSLSKPGKIVTDVAYELGGKEECVVIGNHAKNSCTNAAMANGTFGDANDWGDDHATSYEHVGAVVVPAALATAEREKATGERIIEAVTVGYEVDTRLGEAFLGKHYIQGFHPTSIGGVFGAAAAAAKILDLDREGIIDAFGIAGTQAFGCGQGGWNKRMHTGMASRIGIVSALMAQRRYKSLVTIVENFLNAHSYHRTYDTKQIVGGGGRGKLGEEWRGMLTSFKPYPCCRFLHQYIALTIDMATKYNVNPSDVKQIVTRENAQFHTLHTTSMGTGRDRKLKPVDPIDAQFSIPWTVACAMSRRHVTFFDYFTEQGLKDPEIPKLAPKVRGVIDPEFNKSFPWQWFISITLKLKDGRVITETTKDVPGSPEWVPRYVENPQLFLQDIEAKFRNILSDLHPYENKIDDIVTAVKSLEKVTDPQQVTEIFRARPIIQVPLLT